MIQFLLILNSWFYQLIEFVWIDFFEVRSLWIYLVVAAMIKGIMIFFFKFWILVWLWWECYCAWFYQFANLLSFDDRICVNFEMIFGFFEVCNLKVFIFLCGFMMMKLIDIVVKVLINLGFFLYIYFLKVLRCKVFCLVIRFGGFSFLKCDWINLFYA